MNWICLQDNIDKLRSDVNTINKKLMNCIGISRDKEAKLEERVKFLEQRIDQIITTGQVGDV